MKGEVKGADELRIKGLHVAQGSEKPATHRYRGLKLVSLAMVMMNYWQWRGFNE
jgi:hypothetical protein